MNDRSLTFIVHKKTFIVTFIGDEERKSTSFDVFFNDHLSKDLLKITDKEYSKENLLTFIRKGLVNEEYAFQSENGTHIVFRIVGENDDSFEIELEKREKEDKNNSTSFDYLTEIHSRNYFFEMVSKEIVNENNDNSYIIMFDLDNFKTINDTHGHLIGDICLKTVANKLNDVFKNHIFARYGGDEFIAFVKEVNEEELNRLIDESLKVRFAQNNNLNSKGIITCSLGISGKVGNRTSISLLIEEADKALYKSKKIGKNTAIKDDGTIIYGSLQYRNVKKTKLSKGKSSLIFREEIIKRKKIQFISLFLTIFAVMGVITFMDVFFNYQAADQTKETATELMKEQSDIIALKISEDSNDALAKIESSKAMLDKVSGKDAETLLNNMLETLSSNTILESPGLLLENGDLYLQDGKKYNISSYDFATKIVVENEQAVERISFFGEEDKIIIGKPYVRNLAFSGSDDLSVVGITSMFTVSKYSSLMLNTLKEDYYSAIINSKASKICETKSSNITLFSSYGNLRNYFLENDLTAELNTFNNIIKDNSYNVDLMQLNNEAYFFYSPKIPLSDWTVLILVRYDTINKTFERIITSYFASTNIISIAFLVFACVGLIYMGRLRTDNYSKKYIDPLTRSINLQRFISDANILISREEDQRYLVYLNIRRFKLVNTALGKKNADEFLSKISAYFESKLKTNELLSREYSDRFVMLLEEKDDKALKERVSSIVEGALNSQTLNANSRISFDVGVFRFDFKTENSTPIWLAIDRARKASETANRGGNTYDIKFFSNHMLEDEQLELYIEQSQELALQEGRFVIYYQGKYDLHSKRFEGCEALVRWKDDRKGFINTQKFIDVFERNGFVTKLDLYIFEKVIKDIKQAIDEGRTPLMVSVNLSRKHFENPSFFNEYEKIVAKYNVPWKCLEFEITESIILNNEYELNSLIKRIHELGGKISIDDFGSGFSNFAMINHVDYDILKLDRKLLFGKGGQFDQYSKNVLLSIVSLNHNMHRVTLCEGVEHQEESDYLESIGCDLIQGYFYARPMPKDDFLALLDKTNN